MTANIDNVELSRDHLKELLFEAKCTWLGFARCYRWLVHTARYGRGIFVILIGPI